MHCVTNINYNDYKLQFVPHLNELLLSIQTYVPICTLFPFYFNPNYNLLLRNYTAR